MTDALSAALEDAEGRALVQKILDRKEARNIRDRFFEQMMWGDVHTDGHGNVIPRPEPEHWAAIRTTPVIGEVRWICKAPTETVYAKGTNGWLTEQVLARITPAQREYNRKLAKENAAVMDRFAKLLGVKPHGADG